MSPLLAFVRFRPGVVGETRRTVHLVPLPQHIETTSGSATASPEKLTALCGQTFAPGEAEQLNELRGMPCELCLLRAPRSYTAEVDSCPGVL